MTVKELKERLNKLPDDAVVEISPIEYGDDARIEIWPAEAAPLLAAGLHGIRNFPDVLDIVGNYD